VVDEDTLTGKQIFSLIKMICVPGSGDVQNTHARDEEVRNTKCDPVRRTSWTSFIDYFLFLSCREWMLLAVDLGCKHQVLILILLQQALIHIVVVSND
jgi:hypothetical protein